MFERYTERARRVIFFARYEASQLGSAGIETEHLLLGLIREGKGLTSRLFSKSHLSMEQIRKEVEGRSPYREKVSTSVEIPLSSLLCCSSWAVCPGCRNAAKAGVSKSDF